MYDVTDPRAALAAAPAESKRPAAPLAAPNTSVSTTSRRRKSDPPARPGMARGQNFIIAVTEPAKDAVLARDAQPDEYVVLIARQRDPGRDHHEGRHRAREWRLAGLRAAGKIEPARDRAGPHRAHVHHARRPISRPNAATPPPMPRPSPMSRRTYPGPNPRAAISCASTASMCPRRRAASAASGAARPSWSTILDCLSGSARRHQALAASSRRLRAVLARDRRRVHAPSALAVDGQQELLAQGRSRIVRHPVDRRHPAAVDPHDRGRRQQAKTSSSISSARRGSTSRRSPAGC